ncbi:hypothetical protein NC651_030259 [Populus alba x Populus x berolinensis]|nr:hypothetical protein NC651_030259 [Populus alba x Populus x berolinensis]
MRNALRCTQKQDRDSSSMTMQLDL